MNIIKKNYGIIISIIIVFVFSIYLYVDTSKIREYTLIKSYFDTNVNIKLYTSYRKGNKVKKEIDNLCSYYDKLISNDKDFENIINLHTIENKKTKESFFTIPKELYNLIEYGIKLKEETNSMIDINEGNYLDYYRNIINGENIDKNITNNNEVKLIGVDSILNNHPNLDFHKIIRGYVNEEIIKILKKEKIDKYIINIGGNISFGNHYNNGKYKFALEDPFESGNYYYYLNIENKYVSSMQMDELKEKDGNYYHLYLDYKTKKPANNFKDVVVISDNPMKSEKYKNILYQKSYEEGLEYIKDKNIDVIWYTFDNKIYKTDGIKKYK